MSVDNGKYSSLINQTRSRNFTTQAGPVFSFPIDCQQRFVNSSVILQITDKCQCTVFGQFHVAAIVTFRRCIACHPKFCYGQVGIVLYLIGNPVDISKHVGIILIIAQQYIFVHLKIQIGCMCLATLLQRFYRRSHITQLITRCKLFVEYRCYNGMVTLTDRTIGTTGHLFT